MLEGFDLRASSFAADVDQALWINMGISLVLFLSVVIPMIYFVWKYSPKKVKDEDILNITHNTKLEIAWTLIPTTMLMVLFYFGYTSMRTLRTMPAENESIVINLEGKKWSWSYTYPANSNGYVHKTSKLYVPKDENILLHMSAPINDVIHSFYVPAFRMKEDVVPGRVTKQWFNSNIVGSYDVECAEYCGTRHSYMLSKIVVMPKDEYEKWFNSEKRSPNAEDKKISKGEELFETNGCNGCHSIKDDSIIVGPSLKNISDKYDNTYLKDAILHPNKDIAKGFSAGIMPEFKMSDDEIKAILNFFNNTDKGKEIFEVNGCNGCHSIDDDSIIVGPSLKGIGATKDVSYLRDAIATPNKDIVNGFNAGIMPAFELSKEDSDELIKYLRSK